MWDKLPRRECLERIPVGDTHLGHIGPVHSLSRLVSYYVLYGWTRSHTPLDRSIVSTRRPV